MYEGACLVSCPLGTFSDGVDDCAKCTETTMWYPEKSAGGECQRCHQECGVGCTGPSNTECHNTVCKNVQHRGACLPTCPQGWYWRDGGTREEANVCKGETREAV